MNANEFSSLKSPCEIVVGVISGGILNFPYACYIETEELEIKITKKTVNHLGELKVFRQFRWMLVPEIDIKTTELIQMLSRKRRLELDAPMLKDAEEKAKGKGRSKASASKSESTVVVPFLPVVSIGGGASSSASGMNPKQSPTKESEAHQRILSLFGPTSGAN